MRYFLYNLPILRRNAWRGDERHIQRGGIVLLSNRGKFYGFSNFCVFFLEFTEKNRKFAIRYQLSQYFAMGKYINPFTDWGFKRLFGQEFSKDLRVTSKSVWIRHRSSLV